MRIRFLSGALCALLLLGVWTPAFASEEADLFPEEPMVLAEDAAELPEAESAAVPEEEPDEPEEAEMSEAPPEAEQTPAAMEAPPETEQTPAASEAPVDEDVFGGELPPAGEEELPAGDPDDPLYRPQLLKTDGASYGSTWSAFTTRALNEGETLRRGIDVSAWQGGINWTKVAAAGVEFVIIRAAYRGVGSGALAKDGRFTEYIRGAKAAGLKVGVYIFSQAITTDEAVEEAEYLLDLVSGYEIDLPLVFDLEHYSGGRFATAKLSRRAVTDICLAFCERIDRAGYVSMVYSNPSMLNNDLYAGEIGRLWLANFTSKTSYTSRDYEYWQCSDIGSVDGIGGYVDLDFWFDPGGTAASGDPFTDVKPADWFYESVMACYDAGVVKGMTATTFQPGGETTRGQLVTMLYRMAGEPGWTERASFEDLTQSYYRDAVYWAAELGFVKGYSATEFGPERPITREELVTILYRLWGEPAAEGDLSAYGDGDQVHAWAADAMVWAAVNQLVAGYEDGTLRPRLNANRAVVCTILTRLASLPD